MTDMNRVAGIVWAAVGALRRWTKANYLSLASAAATYLTPAAGDARYDPIGAAAAGTFATLQAPNGPTLHIGASDARLFGVPRQIATLNGTGVSALTDQGLAAATIAQATSANQPDLTRGDNKAGMIPNSRNLTVTTATSGSWSARIYDDELGAPNSAQKFIEAAATASHYWVAPGGFDNTLVAGTAMRLVIDAKQGERTRLFVRASDTAVSDYVWAVFDLSAGIVLGNGVGGTATQGTPTITAIGNGYYRCALNNVALGAADTAITYLAGPTTGTTDSISYAGDGTSGLYVAKGQLMPNAADLACLATGADPQFRGIGVSPAYRPALQFDGAATYLGVTDAASIRSIWGGTGGGYAAMVVRCEIAAFARLAEKGWIIGTESSSGIKLVFYQPRATTAGYWRAVDAITAGATVLLEIAYDESSTSNVPRFWINGSPVALTTVTTPVGAVTTDSGINMGVGARPGGGPGAFFKGAVGEIALWKGMPDDLTISTIRADLARKYGITLS